MSESKALIGGNVQYDYPEQNPEYSGNDLHPDLKRGPLEDRGCKDVFWCILYLAMLVGLVFTSIFAFSKGEPNKLLQPFNTQGNQCGYGALSKYPYVYIETNNNFVSANYTYYCVSSCPTNLNETIDCGEGNCPKPLYPSDLRIITICYPKSSVEGQVKDSVNSIINIGDTQQILADLKNSWPLQLVTAFIALIMSLFVTVLIRYTASCLVWTVIALYFLGLVLLGVFCFETATNPEWQSLAFSSDHGLLKGLAYTAWSIAVLSFLIFLCMFKKVSLAIAVMKAAADFTRQVCEAALVPLVMFVTMVGFFVFWIASSIFLISSGTISASSSTPFGSVHLDSGVGWLLFYELFALYWNCNFAMAFSQFVISSACSMWYFSHLGHDLSHPISKSIVRGLFHHSGSLALGSLILTFIGIIRLLLDQVHKAFKTQTLNKHGVVEGCEKCWFSYCNYCLKYFEKFIRYLTQNAYIMIGLTGESFCTAAHDSFYLLARNAGKVMVTHGVGEVFTILGNLFIGICSTMLGYVMLTQIDYFADNIVSPVVPTIGFLIISLVIGSLFMNVYGMAVDSILLCYIADSELHRNEGGAKSVPSSLKEFLAEYN